MKQRLAVIEYVRQYGIKLASRQFGLARPTVRQWWRNWQRAGIQGWCLSTPRSGDGGSVTTSLALITQARLKHDALAAWEYPYNHERLSMALRGRTPMNKLAAMLARPLVMVRAPDSVQ